MQEINHSANPFPGLRPFECSETHLFFGRDGQSEELLRRLKRTRFLAVVGTSGSGKSSLVRAGLLPALQGGLMASAGSDWRIAILRPGNDPIGNLARALVSPTVLGSGDDKSADMQCVLAETTLRRSSLGLVELVSRARTKLDEHGQPLLPDYENLLVVVDQFEELFRFKQLIEEETSKEDAAAFVKLLLEAVRQPEGKIYVVLTMRSDFLGDCSHFWELPEAINNGQYLIPRMTRDERREAIIGPVAVGEGAISEPLVNQLLNDVGDNPDQLPIMQHALMRTWDYWLGHRRDGDAIDIPDYDAIGAMDEALWRHADEAYAELSGVQEMIAEKLFKGLTEKGADNREIRRPMEVHEICELTGADEAAVIAVLEVFRHNGRSFLMPPATDPLSGAPIPLTGQSLIDISHESLIRNWGRLKEWVEEESQSARIYKRLAETAVLHKAGEEALLKDPALQVGLDWRDKNRPNAGWARRYHPEFETAMSFLDASAAASAAEKREREMQHRKEISYKRTKFVALILAFSVLLSLGSAAYAFLQRGRAETARAVAEQKTVEAMQQRSFAEDQRRIAEGASAEAIAQGARAIEEQEKAKKDRELAERQAELARANEILAKQAQALALQQKARANVEAARANLEAARADAEAKRASGEATRASMEAARANDEAAKNKQLLYAADINLAQRAYESSNIERVSELLKGYAPTLDATRGFEWHYLSHLLDSEKWSRQPPEPELLAILTLPDGKTLAVGAGRTVEFWDIGSGEKRPGTITLPDEFLVGTLAVTLDGKKLAVGDGGGRMEVPIRVYDLHAPEKPKEIGALGKSSEQVNSLFFSRDGSQLIVGGGRGSVSLWDVNSSREMEVLPVEGTIFLDISRDGKMLAAGSVDSEKNTFPVLLWDMTAPKKVAKELLGHGGAITSVAFTPDGKKLATGSKDKTVRLWDTKSRRPLRILSFDSKVFSVVFSQPDGHFLAIGCEDGSIKLYDTENYVEYATLIGHHEAITALYFSTDGSLLFSCDNKRDYETDPNVIFFKSSRVTRVKSWDFATLTREQTPVLVNEGDYILSSAFSPDGKKLALIDNYGGLALWDTEKNGPSRTLSKDFKVRSVAFSPDGKLIGTAGEDNTVRLWDASTEKQVGAPLRGDSVLKLAFSHDSKLLAAGMENGAVKVWDIASWKLVSELPGEKDAVTGLSFSSDGKSLAFSRSNGTVEFWDRKLEKLLRQFKIQASTDSDKETVAFSPDGSFLAVGYKDGSAVLYDTNGIKLPVLKGDGEAPPFLTFSPDSRILVTGGEDGTLKLWDTVSRRELLTLRCSYRIVSAAFSLDGKRLATVDMFYLRTWRAPTADIASGAQSKVQ